MKVAISAIGRRRKKSGIRERRIRSTSLKRVVVDLAMPGQKRKSLSSSPRSLLDLYSTGASCRQLRVKLLLSI
jgi:hypothetical protein